MADELEARLQGHAHALDGLMSLIPAKYYYEKDTTDDWQKKKQTPEQRRAAKRAKLNPESHKSAKEIMDENEKKRKRELEEDDDISDLNAPGKEKPQEGLKKAGPKAKKPKTAAKESVEAAGAEMDETAAAEKQKLKAEKRKAKADRKKEKLAKQLEKRAAKKESSKEDAGNEAVPVEKSAEASQPDDEQTPTKTAQLDEELVIENDIEPMDVTGLIPEEESSSVSPSPPADPADTPVQIPSSNSSVVPPADQPTSAESAKDTEPSKAKEEKPKIDTEALKARLHARIKELQAKRGADGLDGKPARNRAELIEARRRKAEARKLHKKELRKQAKEDEKREEMEAELARLRGSGSPFGGSDMFATGSRSPDAVGSSNLAFGRVLFSDGQIADPTLTRSFLPQTRKGPSDPKTALEAAEKKAQRLSAMDPEQRKKVEESDMWLNARKKAHGERVRDDRSLLKRTLKQKEKIKARSEKEWAERQEAVRHGQEQRQKKREGNIAKRKEEKGSKGKKKGGPKKKARAGFEGTFKAKSK
ncbi:SURF6-domain-containing protein [Trichodelitschia bisporula]|uniref:SURF6-domain-containing protein n=1 Tax=Trichodelitschia bisporula TaxID=703511 RepID=A0A6G1I2R5_9PEZI|nr:SURF6-domain-containing protein [Trichodelitschia bisporula]